MINALSNLLPPRSSLFATRTFLLALTSSLLAFLLPQAAEAYYIEETLTLAKGWNAVMLESTPSNSFCSAFFEGLPVDRVYTQEEMRGVVEPQYDEKGELKEAPPTKTLVWLAKYADDGNVSTLTGLRGGVSYFIHATNAASRTFLGTPAPPEFAWFRVINNTNEFLNVAGVFLDSATPVNAKTYFGDGGPFSSPDNPSDESKMAVYTFGSKTVVDPVSKKETDELALLPVTSKNLAPGKAYALTSAQNLECWPGVIGFADRAPYFSLRNQIVRQGIRNMSASERTFRVTVGSGKGGLTFPPNLRLSTCSQEWADPEPPWGEPAADGTSVDITVPARGTYWLWLRCNSAELSEEKSYGAVLSVTDVTAGGKSSRMRVRQPIYVAELAEGSINDTPDVTGLWAGTITLDQVSSLTNTTPFAAAGAMTANVLVFVPSDRAAQAELLQQVALGSFEIDKGVTSNALYRTLDLVPTTAKGRRRISTAMMSTACPRVTNVVTQVSQGLNSDGFGTACVFRWSIGPKTKDHPYRHAWHPDHDGKTADYSADAPDGNRPENYMGGQVKPELWTIGNELTLVWEDKKKPETGVVTWTVTGLTGTTDTKKPLVSKGRFELKRVLTTRSIVEKL